MSTPHNSAAVGDFADTVLIPGDPKRATFIAKRYLENAVLVNDVRGIQGYTGYYQGKRISVMGSGMGQPSMGIYAHELFNYYDVKCIIRIGTCGGFDPDLELSDVVIAQGACTNSSFNTQFHLPGTFCPIADFELMCRAVDECKARGVNYKVGNILSSDFFYSDSNDDLVWAKMGVLGVEMEAAALYAIAARFGKKALCLCSVSNSIIDPKKDMPPIERETTLVNMIEVALSIAE